MKCSFCQNDLKYVVSKEKDDDLRMEIYSCLFCNIMYNEYPRIIKASKRVE
jgi:hypothetical protein